MKIFVFGNGNISFSNFVELYQKPLEKYLEDKTVEFILCDFRGVDTLMMELLKCVSGKVTIFHMGDRPRYQADYYRTKVSNWKLVGGYLSDQERDLAAINYCTHYLGIDFNSTAVRKSGTQRNIELCEEYNKVYLMSMNTKE